MFKRQIHLSEHLSGLEVEPLFSFVVSICMYDKVQLLHWPFSTKDTLAFISVLSGRLRAFIFSKEVESQSVVLSNQIFKQNFRFFWDFPLWKTSQVFHFFHRQFLFNLIQINPKHACLQSKIWLWRHQRYDAFTEASIFWTASVVFQRSLKQSLLTVSFFPLSRWISLPLTPAKESFLDVESSDVLRPIENAVDSRLPEWMNKVSELKSGGSGCCMRLRCWQLVWKPAGLSAKYFPPN